MLCSITPQVVEVDEFAGTVCITINRTGGAFGTIGSEYLVTGITATGEGVDFSPDSGSIELEPGVQIRCLPINIVNDIQPEQSEVRLVYYTQYLHSSSVCLSCRPLL